LELKGGEGIGDSYLVLKREDIQDLLLEEKEKAGGRSLGKKEKKRFRLGKEGKKESGTGVVLFSKTERG